MQPGSPVCVARCSSTVEATRRSRAAGSTSMCPMMAIMRIQLARLEALSSNSERVGDSHALVVGEAGRIVVMEECEALRPVALELELAARSIDDRRRITDVPHLAFGVVLAA